MGNNVNLDLNLNAMNLNLSPASASYHGNFDFKQALGRLFDSSNNILKQYADPNEETVDIMGFGEVNKNSPSAQLAVGIGINRIETQLNTLLSGLEFTLKTLPQKLDSLFS